jgi:5'-nucleotidase
VTAYDILLTNDDGYKSPGLAAVRDALIDAGLRTVTFAPDGPRSGTARSASFRKAIVPKLVSEDSKHPVYAVDGTPVDCVRVGIISGLCSNARLVVSGINEGANLGDDATYSSTLGAAVEGALLGRAALSVSQQSLDGRFRLIDRTGYDFTWSARITVALAKRMLIDSPPARTVMNVNAPASSRPHKLEITRLDRRRWDAHSFKPVDTPDGPGWFTFLSNSDEDPIFEGKPGTDVAALSRGLTSVSPLSFAWGEWRTQRNVHAWTRRAVDALNRDLESVVANAAEQEHADD